MIRKNKLASGITLAFASLMLASCASQPPKPSGPETTSHASGLSSQSASASGLSTSEESHASGLSSSEESHASGLSSSEESHASGLSTSEESGQQSDQSDSTPTPSGPHGPEGSVAVSWYLCGSGSLWGETGWTIEGGVQLFSNPDSATDKGCILSLAVAVDDLFKVTDGTTWFGYDKVDQWDDPSNAGKTNFAALDDGFGGSNIQCTVAGTYDIYVNEQGKFWIQLSA